MERGIGILAKDYVVRKLDAGEFVRNFFHNVFFGV